MYYGSTMNPDQLQCIDINQDVTILFISSLLNVSKWLIKMIRVLSFVIVVGIVAYTMMNVQVYYWSSLLS